MARALGNVYIDPAYTSQEAIEALGGTSSITGETLVYGSTLEDLANGANAFVPNGMTKWFKIEGQTVYAAEGATMYVSNYNVNNESFYSDGTYGLYFKGSSANYIYGLPKTAGTYTLENGINITLEDSLVRNTLAPGAFRSDIIIVGDFNINISGSTINSLNLGGGTTYQQYGTINGDIKFDVRDTAVTGGDFHIHSGRLSNSEYADELAIVTGTVSNVTVSGSFRGLQTDSGNDNRTIGAKFDVVVTGSSVNGDIGIGWFNNPADWTGSYVLTVAGSTSASIQGNASTATEADTLPDVEKFDLVLGGSEAKTVTGQIRRFKTITIDAGAKVQATSIDGIKLVNLAQGAEVSVGQFTGLETLAVTGEYTAVSNTLISGITSFSRGDIANVTLNGTSLEYGFMPGQYSLVGDKLVLHEGDTVLVNSTYSASGQQVTYKDKVYTGYKTVADAQSHVLASEAVITLVPTEESATIESEGVVTKDYTVVFQGEENSLSMGGFNLVVGETGVKHGDSTVIISGLKDLGGISFGDLDSLFLDASNVTGTENSTIDFRDADIASADATFSGVSVKDIYLPTTNTVDGTLAINSGSVGTIYNDKESDGKLKLKLGSGAQIGTVFSEGKPLDIGDATVGTYYGGLMDGGSLDTINFAPTKASNITILVLGGQDFEDKANTIGSVNAKISAGGIDRMYVGGDYDTITGDVNVELAGPVGIAAPGNGTFTGIVYGADIGTRLNGGSAFAEGTSTLNVTGHARVGEISGFDVINVTGGTLNVSNGSISGDAAITNRRTISAKGTIYASSITNSGVITASEAYLSGSLTNSGELRMSGQISLEGGSFNNSGTIYAESISVNSSGLFKNSGVIYVTSENGYLGLNADVDNSGTIYATSLNGAKNITTSSLIVAREAYMDGTLTVNADSRVAFQNGLYGYTGVTIDATSTLTVGGSNFDGDGKTLTVNVGDMIGYNEIVRANDGADSWTIKFAGLNKANYDYIATETSIIVYSTDEVFVNSGFSADSDCIVDGHKLLYGKNAFATVAEAVAAAKTGAKIVVVGETNGKDIDAGNFDVVLDGSVVGNITTSKTVSVTSDSKAKSIASASGLTIEAGALLSVTDTIPANLPITIDASKGSGSRLVLDVDTTKVTLSEDQVTVIGKASYGKRVLGGESAHAGDLYFISDDIVYFAPNKYVEEEIEVQQEVDGVPQVDEAGNPIMVKVKTGNLVPTFADGEFDKATGDALFNNVNIFDTKADAESAARASSGTIVIVDHMTKNQNGFTDVNTAFEVDMVGASGNNSIYGGVGSDTRFTATADHTTMILGSTMRGNLYALAKTATIGADYTYTFVMKDSVQLQNGNHGTYFVSRDDGSQIDGNVNVVVSNSTYTGQATTTVGGNSTINGDVNYDISGSTFTAGLYLVNNGNMNAKVNGDINAEISGSSITDFHVGSGSFGLSEEDPIDVNVTFKNSRIANLRGFRLSEDANIKPVINANLNLTVLDTTVTGAFYALYTGDWRGDSNVTLRYSAYNSGSMTVTLGGSTFGGWNDQGNRQNGQIHGGDSLTHGRNALQNFNVPTTLHIVKGEQSATTDVNWVMEWETIVVDADATLVVNYDIQYLSGDVNSNRLPNSGQVPMYKINLAGFEGGTRQVIRANSIYALSDRSNIEMIGNEDISGNDRYELLLIEDGTTLKQVGLYDKASDIYLNSTYTSGVRGTFDGNQVLYFDYNALNDAEVAAYRIVEWNNAIVVTGGSFNEVDYGTAVTVRGGAVVGTLNGVGSDSDSTVTLKANANVGSVIVAEDDVEGDATVVVEGALASETSFDGSKSSVTGKSTLDVKADSQLGDVADFDTVKVAKGANVLFGEVSGTSLSVFADNSIYADSITLGSDTISVDVTGYTGGSRALIITQDGITDYKSGSAVIVGEGKDNYSLVYSIDAETQEGVLSLLSSTPTDVYLNSTYDAETTGTFYDGVYLTYGGNAFSSFADAVANVRAGYSVILTGGEFDAITVDGAKLLLKDGTVGTLSAGTGASTLTVDGLVSVTDAVEDFNGITITAGSTLTTDHIDFVAGSTVTITGTEFTSSAEAMNLHKVIDTTTGIAGAAAFVSDNPNFYAFVNNNDLFLLDKTRIYVDPTFTESSVTGTTVNGDHLIWGVNAFSEINDACNNALVRGGTLYALHWGTAGTQAPDIRPGKPASIVAQGPTNFSIVYANNARTTINEDVHIVMDNTGTPQAGSGILNGADNAKWVFNGNVYVTFKGSNQVNSNGDFGVSKFSVFNGDLFQINIEKPIHDDIWMIRNYTASDFANLGKLEVNITGMTSNNGSKWIGIFRGDNVALPSMKVVMNITDSVFNGGDWSVGLVQGGNGSNAANFDVHLNNSTIQGWISGGKSVKWMGGGGAGEGIYAGTRTLYVDGTKQSTVIDARMFHHFVISADASLNVTGTVRFLDAHESEANSITIDLTGYTGSDKMFLSASNFRLGNQDNADLVSPDEIELKILGNEEGKYIGGFGVRHGAFVITQNGDVFYNANFDATNDNGLAVGNTFVLINSNAFTDYSAAKSAIDDRKALGLDRNFNIGGVSEGNSFYADGYKVNVYGGTYASGIYGSDRNGDSVDSVNMTVTGGLFTGSFGVSDGDGSVTGDARIEIAGGTFGTPAVDTEQETKDEVPVNINGSKDKVGGTSTLVLSKDLVADTATAIGSDIIGSVTDFDSVVVGKGIANMVISHDLSSTSITVDASSQLTVLGNLTADTITIDATEYVGPSKVIAISSSFETVANQPAVTVEGDLTVYDFKYVEDTLYLVSKHAGNVYLNSAWDESISGTVYNGELLVWGINATNSMDEAALKLNDDYTLFVTGGQFDGTYTFSGKASIDIRDSAVTVGGLVLGDGSSVKLSGITAGGASSIGTIAAVEGATAGYSLTVNDKTAIDSISGVRNFTFSAGKDITVSGGVTYVENGGSLVVDLAGYTQTAETATLLDSEVSNFLQPVAGQTYSKTVVGAANNDALIMPYYDEEKKAVIGVKAGRLGMIVMPNDERNNDDSNGTVVTIEGVTGTLVYGYNLNETPETVATYIDLGGTIYADGIVSRDGYTPYFFTNKPLDAVITNCNISGLVVGYDNGDQYHGARYRSEGKTRTGAFNFLAENSVFNWYTNIAAYGYNNGTDDKCFQTLIVADYDSEKEEYVDTQYNITINGSTNNCTLRIAEYAKISGGTVNVNLNDLLIGGEVSLFRHTYNANGDDLDEVNVVLNNSRSNANNRWIYVWDVDEGNSTDINLTITDTVLTGGTEQNIGIFGECANGTWDGTATVTISGFTTEGRLGARGCSNNDLHLDRLSGDITLKVEGENNVRIVRDFTKIDIADDVVLRGAEIRLDEGAQFILRGETGYKGDAKEYVVVGTTITGISKDNAFFLDDQGETIEGYAAVIGNTNVFVYSTTGDVYFNTTFSEATTGTYITESDGIRNILVYGDNAVSGIVAAAYAMDKRGGDASIIVLSGPNTFETRGYRTVFEGGKAINVWGGYRGDSTEAQETVASANITVNSGATVTNIYAASEMGMVSGNANITIGDGTAILGTIDGADNFVAGDSFLTFKGTASVKGDVLGFQKVYIDADSLVSVTGAVSDTVINIDTTDFTNSSRIVMTSDVGFGEGVTVTVGEGFQAEISSDRKSIMVVSPLVGDAYFSSEWDSSITGTIIDGVELVWNKNAFSTINEAITAVGKGYSVVMAGGVSTEAADLDGHDFVVSGAQIGEITSAGATLTVKDTLTAGSISGFSAINMVAKPITVTGAVSLAQNATLTIDATGYSQVEDDVVLISAGEGITNLTTTSISVTGTTAYGAYVSQEDGNVHMVRLTKNVFFSTEYSEEATQGVKDPLTGEILFFGKNAFNTLTPALNSVVEGGTVFVYNRNGQVNPSGTTPMNLHLVGGTVTALRVKSGDQGSSTQQVNVPISLTVDGTVLSGDMDYILGRGNTYQSVEASLAYYEPVTVTLKGGTNTGNIRFVGQWSSILGDVTLNMKDWTLLGDIKPFAGDARFGSDATGLSKIVWNWENVSLPTSKWIAVANVTDWGAQKVGVDGTSRQSMDAIEFTIKNSNLRGSTSRIAALVEGNDGRHNSNTDITFTVEDSSIDCLLTASVTTNLTNSTAGVKTLKITGTSSFIQWANWFQILDIATADTFLSGGTVTFQGSGVINVDATGYTGGSKVLVSLTSGFRQSDDTKPVELNLTQDGDVYELVYGPKALVLKSNVIENVYVNSTYTTAVTGSTYAATGELLIFDTNAFINMADALTVLPADGGIFVTGGSVAVASALPSNNLTIDAGANLTYTGGVAITITDTFVNNGMMTISTEGFDLSSGKALALSAGSIAGTGTYQVIGDERYLISKQENELYFVMRKNDVYVDTKWATEESGAIVTLISGETATIGIDAFATGLSALNNVIDGGTITIEGGTVTFGSEKVAAQVTALEGVTVDTVLIDKGGNLTVSAGAVSTNVTVRSEGSLTVEAGAIQTGTLALGNGATATINGTLDFDLIGVSVSADPIVTNINYVVGAPSYTITVDASQTDGTYKLASGAADFSFTAPITVKTISAEIGKITALDQAAYLGGAEYTLSVTEGILTLTKETKESPITVTFVNSAWADTAEGTVVIEGGTFGYNAFATGDEAIAAVVDFGEVNVIGGTVSFTDAIAKTVSINASSTLIGNATFATAVTIDGTVAFDTAYVKAEAAQFDGFSFVSGETKYTLSDAAGVVGEYKLASGVTEFTAGIAFNGETLTVGGDAVVVEDLDYSIAIVGSDLVLSVSEHSSLPALAYVNAAWSSEAEGTVVNVHGTTAVIGYDAFATLDPAIAGTSADAQIYIVEGGVTFANGYSKSITVDSAAYVYGAATFDTPITINGSVLFDLSLTSATEAQFKGYSNVTTSSTTSYILTADASTGLGTYLLASDAADFSSDVSLLVGGAWYTLKVNGKGVLVGDFTYSLGITDNNDLALKVSEFEPQYFAKGDRDGNGISDVMFVRTQEIDPGTGEYHPGNHAHGYWMNGKADWWSANAPGVSSAWDNLGSYDMNGDGLADAVMFGNVTTESGIKGAYIGFYSAGNDMDGWQNIGYLSNDEDVAWQTKVGNLTGNYDGKNSIVWYAPERYVLGFWKDGTNQWVGLSLDFGSDAWTLAGCGDFTGTGKDSVLMSYNGGQTFISIDANGVQHYHGGTNWSGWDIRAIGDFAGDGKDDIVLFHEASGSMVMLADGNTDNWASIGQLNPGDWFIAGCGDYNNDQQDDLLVRQYSTGMLGYYTNGVQANWNVMGYGVTMEWTVIA